MLQCIFGGNRPAEGMSEQHELPFDLQQCERGLQVIHQLRHVIAGGGLVGQPMPAQVQGDYAVLKRKRLQLIMPLLCLSPKAMDKNKSPLGMIGRYVDRRKSNQRICGNTKLMTVKVEVDVHAKSLHEGGTAVNL